MTWWKYDVLTRGSKGGAGLVSHKVVRTSWRLCLHASHDELMAAEAMGEMVMLDDEFCHVSDADWRATAEGDMWHGESLDDVLDQDLSKRNHVSSAVLASSGSPQKKLKLTSTPKQCEATTLASSNDNKRNLMENKFWSMLPSGFGDIYGSLINVLDLGLLASDDSSFESFKSACLREKKESERETAREREVEGTPARSTSGVGGPQQRLQQRRGRRSPPATDGGWQQRRGKRGERERGREMSLRKRKRAAAAAEDRGRQRRTTSSGGADGGNEHRQRLQQRDATPTAVPARRRQRTAATPAAHGSGGSGGRDGEAAAAAVVVNDVEQRRGGALPEQSIPRYGSKSAPRIKSLE
ncbi:hypothetical protein Scep_022138 [Stephania cephalantha]|uniref:Uncharacterized protein n=1 Tax=Stephania cephalantha TaxID=152367 RepID=A0AAP0FGC5_9MAGN